VTEVAVLGVDLGTRWATTGSALLAYAGDRWTTCAPCALAWPDAPVSPGAMAGALDRFARARGVRAIGIDGPHAWRHPDAAARPGVGRWCEYLARTPGKTGARGRCFPATYLAWVEFAIALFDALLALPGVALANGRDAAAPRAAGLDRAAGRAGGYLLLECFPTATWRSSGLGPLPAKARATPAAVEAWSRRLAAAYGLPASAVTDRHDDLQALVAALPAAALLGGPATLVAHGTATVTIGEDRGAAHRVEGFIWDAAPLPVRGAAAR
jgi:hypothetical protein